jgi:hypothetical protein
MFIKKVIAQKVQAEGSKVQETVKDLAEVIKLRDHVKSLIPKQKIGWVRGILEDCHHRIDEVVNKLEYEVARVKGELG